ncbi:hypothetical protein BD779DRAFT_1676894 [Infundibulicybe gibba]|nr:hypothetical protein BD779DRAFT_1676894 [Infundibulicybe gibba]
MTSLNAPTSAPPNPLAALLSGTSMIGSPVVDLSDPEEIRKAFASRGIFTIDDLLDKWESLPSPSQEFSNPPPETPPMSSQESLPINTYFSPSPSQSSHLNHRHLNHRYITMDLGLNVEGNQRPAKHILQSDHHFASKIYVPKQGTQSRLRP